MTATTEPFAFGSVTIEGLALWRCRCGCELLDIHRSLGLLALARTGTRRARWDGERWLRVA